MGKINSFVIILIGCWGVLSCSQPENKSNNNKTRSGKEIFTTICSSCHGLDGQAGINGAANLAKSNLNEAGMAYMIENGSLSSKMASYKGILSPDEITAVATYAATLKSNH